MARDKLDEMSHDLSERERKQLLKKLEGSPEADSPEPIRPVELKTEERARLITEEMQKVGWLTRLLMWLEGLVTGRDARTVFVSLKVRELKTRIRHVNPNLTGFESRDLTPRFADLVYDLFYRVTPLVDVCKAFTKDRELVDFAFTTLVESGWPGAKKNVEELVPLEEMERAYSQKTNVEEIRKLLVKSLADYLKTVPQELVSGLVERIRPLLVLEHLVLFSYGSLFRYFNYVVREPLEQKHPHFDHAPAMLLLSHMERLLCGIQLAREIPEEWVPPEDLVRLYLLKRPSPPAPEEADKETKRLQEATTRLLESVREVGPRLPLLDLVRYFRRDPYYRLTFTTPAVDVVGAYARSLKTRFFDELREKLDTVKLRALSHRTMDFFRAPLTELANYNDRPEFDFRKLGLPYFSNTHSLTLLSNYLGRIYKSYVYEVIQLASTTVLATNKLVQNRLMQCNAQMEDVDARIAHFDRSLAPDAEDGKALVAFRHNLSSDALQQRFYKTFIADKDRQARALVEKAQTQLAEIARVLDEAVNSPTETVKAILKTNQLLRGKTQTLLSLMSTRRDNLKEFLGILEQTVAYDRGI